MHQEKPKKPIKSADLTNQIEFSKASEKGRFTKMLNALHLLPVQMREIRQFYAQADKNGLNVQQTTTALSQFDAEVENIKKDLEPAVQKKIKELKKLQLNKDLVLKFKTSLPLLSHILASQIASGLKKPFEKLWVDLENEVWFYEMKSKGGLDDSDLPPKNEFVRRMGIISMFHKPDGTYEFTCGASLCVDGAPDAYGPNDKGTDFTKNAGREGHWWGVVTDKWEAEEDSDKSKGSPLIKKDGFYISTTAYNYDGQLDNVQARYVDANIVPFSVLAHETMMAIKELNKTKPHLPLITLGDLIYVYNSQTNKGVWTALLEKRDKEDHVGEVSLAAAKMLGIKKLNPRNGGQDYDANDDGNNISFIIYPNTSPIKQEDSKYPRFMNNDEAIDYILRNGHNIDGDRKVDRNPRMRVPK